MPTRYGTAAFRALAEVVAAGQAGDPLAPVTVVVPSNYAGVATRRWLAAHGRGIAGLNVVTLYRLAEQLAAPRLAGDGRRPVTAPIVTAAIRLLGLGTVVGTRTWGGVIGIDGRYKLVDGTVVTQPRYSFWFEGLGWGVENYGVDPDVEVVARPQDRVSGNDVELDHALTLIERELKRTPPLDPPPLPAPQHG